MLNKDICKKCKRKTDSFWNKANEKLWKNNRVWCVGNVKQSVPLSKLFGIKQISTNSIPDSCPYKLEHLILGKQIYETK